MISTGLTQIIIYQSDNLGSYKYKNSYEICIGTICKELGLSTQFCMDLSTFSKSSNRKLSVNSDSIYFTYEMPKIIDNEVLDFLEFEHGLKNLDPKLFITRPFIILVESSFNFDLINKYIENYKEYGVKEIK